MTVVDGDRTTLVVSAPGTDDELHPKGLDTHRYRCCGNGVATPVAEWLGSRLRDALRDLEPVSRSAATPKDVVQLEVFG